MCLICKKKCNIMLFKKYIFSKQIQNSILKCAVKTETDIFNIFSIISIIKNQIVF